MNNKNQNDDVICIIPARGGSKGLKNKNTLLLNNKPLISRPIKHALDSGVIGTILVSTDDKNIAEIAKESGAIVPFLRPSELAQDLSTTEETLKHALLKYENEINRKFDICVFLTATDIFRNVEWIKKAVFTLRNNPDIDSVFTGFKTHKNFWEKNENGKWVRLRKWMANYQSRQVRKFIIREDTGLSCASRAWLWREGRRIGEKVEIIVHENNFSFIDIHSQNDIDLARHIVENFEKE